MLSAGFEQQPIDSNLTALLSEIGISVNEPVSRQVTTEQLEEVDIVVTLCDPELARCPIPPQGVRHVNWTIPGPSHFSADHLEGLRGVRDAIVTETHKLLLELGVLKT